MHLTFLGKKLTPPPPIKKAHTKKQNKKLPTSSVWNTNMFFKEQIKMESQCGKIICQNIFVIKQVYSCLRYATCFETKRF